MAIGLLTDDEFDRELASFRAVKSRSVEPKVEVIQTEVEVIQPEHGRSEGHTNIPESLRKIIGETSVIEGRKAALDLARDFGISASSVSAYAKGASSTTTYKKPVSQIVEHINRARYRSIGKANKVLNSAIDGITPEKLENMGPRNLAGIARDMSTVIKNLEPPTEQVNANPANDSGPKFVIYAPQFKTEQSFESIVINE